MFRKYDLHSHTKFSDGEYSPCKLLQIAKNRGIYGLAITDHDTVDGIPEAIECAKSIKMEVIPGVELSTRLQGLEFHILGLFIDYQNIELLEFLNSLKNLRVERAKKIIENLQSLGIDISFDEVAEIAKNSPIGRPHIAQILVKKKIVTDFYQAFHKYLGDYAPANELKVELQIPDAIKLIHNSGGLAFLAHPGRIDKPILDEIIAFGLDGIEICHPSMGKAFTKRYTEITKTNNLLKSIGSDFHGGAKDDYDTMGKYFLAESDILYIKKKLKRKHSEKVA